MIYLAWYCLMFIFFVLIKDIITGREKWTMTTKALIVIPVELFLLLYLFN